MKRLNTKYIEPWPMTEDGKVDTSTIIEVGCKAYELDDDDNLNERDFTEAMREAERTWCA